MSLSTAQTAIADRIKEQSRLGRRVALLLSALNEHSGGLHHSDLSGYFPNGLRGELPVVLKCKYAIRSAQHKFTITAKGVEVILWLVGHRDVPTHWKDWEDKARLKEMRTRQSS